MKLIDKVIYFIFSTIVLAIVVIVFMGLLNIGGVNHIFSFIGGMPNMNFTQEQMTYIIIVGILLIIMAIKGILFQSKLEENKDAIILENSSGKLIISRRTLENLVKDISNSVKGVENSSARVNVEKDTDLIISIDIVVKEGSIKDITKKLQEDVKIAIKKASDLNVSEVNVNIKNIKKMNENTTVITKVVENKKEGNNE
ncbi:MAG: alkaline shock response membrane anchor protein AmaP [Clostridiales bacterium]|nr:alkaline shock response membrane anchor protein AmaP [Clostridiales bacterium]